MRFSILGALATFIAVSATVATAAPSQDIAASEPVSYANLTTRTTSSSNSWEREQCKTISGSYRSWGKDINYDFGCLCLDDVDDFADQNDINDAVKFWIKLQFWLTPASSYPEGSEPTCDGRGGYTCPQGKKLSDGTCSTVPASCGRGYVAQKDGSCCVRGTSKIGGRCCATTCKGVSNGKCVGAATCSSGETMSSSGLCCSSGYTGYQQVCCPSGQKEDPNNLGTCICSDVSAMISTSDSTKCVSKCSGVQSWQAGCGKSGACCRADMTTVKGACGCAAGTVDNGKACVTVCKTGYTWQSSLTTPACLRNDLTVSASGVGECKTGYKDNGSACISKCTTGQTYSSVTNTCKSTCSATFTWMKSTDPKDEAGLCCASGSTAQKTVCCPSGQSEVATGVCCATGSTYNSMTSKCISPSGVNKKKRAAMASLLAQSKLSLDEKHCPTGFSACPIPGAAADAYECLDVTNELQSCGGCATLGTGQDCTQIPGARFMGCSAGQCAVYSCKRGWKLMNGTTCVRA